jgi:hypothetical protein
VSRLPQYLGAKSVGGTTRLCSSRTGFSSTPGTDPVVLVSQFTYRILFYLGCFEAGSLTKAGIRVSDSELGPSAPELSPKISQTGILIR